MRDVVNLDYALLIPELLLGVLALVLLGVDLLMPKVRKDALPLITAVGLVVTFFVSLAWVDKTDNFAGLIAIDDYTTFFRCFFIAMTFAVVVMSGDYVKKHIQHPAEYYSLLIMSTIGAIYMAAAIELLTAYIALELLSFSLYVLVSFAKRDARSGEAGMKYMLLGAFASAFLLYGISFIYGTAGSTTYSEIAAGFSNGTSAFSLGSLAGLALIIAGLGFKVAAVPFHMWTPDAYEGAPLPITAYLSTASKVAGFALLLRLFSTGLLPVIDQWQFMMAALSAITMLVGNVLAIQQHNIKRLLAYSSIGQVGYMLMGITALSPDVSSALLLHMLGYVATNLAVFTAITAYHNATGAEELHDFSGMSDRAPLLAAVMAAGMFSLAGMPLFAGFFTKFIFFQSVASNDYYWLAGIAVVASLISLYYYLYLIREMYVGRSEGPRYQIPMLLQGSVIALTAAVFFVGVYPTPLYKLTDTVAAVLFAT